MKKTILVIDDSQFFRKILSVLLTSAGYNTITVAGATEAEEFLLKNEVPVDLILVDLMMPEVTGFHFLEWLKKTYGDKAPRVFAMTGEYPLLDVLDKVRKMNAAGIVNKAVPADQIVFRINTILYGNEKESGRRHARVGVSTPVNYLLEGRFDQGGLSNVSISGAFVLTSAKGNFGAKMALEFILPGIPELIVVRGTVVRVGDLLSTTLPDSNTGGLGIEFSEVGLKARECLARFVEKRIREDLSYDGDNSAPTP